LLAADYIHDPEDLLAAARSFSYGSKTGIDLPAEIGGRLPDDLTYNRTGLTRLPSDNTPSNVTPLQTAVMLSTIANGGQRLKPKFSS